MSAMIWKQIEIEYTQSEIDRYRIHSDRDRIRSDGDRIRSDGNRIRSDRDRLHSSVLTYRDRIHSFMHVCTVYVLHLDVPALGKVRAVGVYHDYY